MSGDYLSNRMRRPSMKIRGDLRQFMDAGEFHSALEELNNRRDEEE